MNNVLQPDAQVSPFAFLNPVQTLVVSTSAPATWLLPTEIAFALFLFLLPQNSSRRKHKCRNHGSNRTFVYSNCRMFHTKAPPLFFLTPHLTAMNGDYQVLVID